jgi:hypothetical protein
LAIELFEEMANELAGQHADQDDKCQQEDEHIDEHQAVAQGPHGLPAGGQFVT